MFLIYYISDALSCPEDRSSAWVNMKHSEVPKIPPESFPGASGRSWTVALAAVRLCSQPPWSRCTLPSSPLPIAHLCVFSQVRWLAEEWRTGPFLPVCRQAQAMLSAFLQLDGHCNAFRTSRSVGSLRDADCIRIAIVEHRGKGKVVLLRKKDVGDVPLLF